MSDLFASPEMAAGYARSRPAVHPRVIELARARLGIRQPVGRALDVGCGAGLSTAPLAALACFCIGVEPVEAMLRGSALASAAVAFVTARAEALPIAARSVELLTAAGSLNYVDLDAFFGEATRVLHPDGALVVYDFSAGRTVRDSPRLDDWFTEFLVRYPRAEGSARKLDSELLADVATGFRLAGSEQFEIGLELSADRYCDYVMTETNVAHAIRNGQDPEVIREWCAGTLGEVFAGSPREVLFHGYLAHLLPA